MRKYLRSDESGMALLTVLLVSMLACALMAGVFAAIASDQRSLGFDRDQSQAYAAAHAGLEKLTTQVAQLFVTDFSPNASQISAASTVPPSISGFNFVAPGGGDGYAVSFNADPCASCPNKGNPMPSPSNDITTGPFAGFKGLITPYTLTVTARSAGGGSEVRLRREIQTVAVPVFQFGIFGERSLSFHAGATFDFGGRVHTNEHLFLAQGGGTLTFRDKLTAVGEVVRSQLENTVPITSSTHTGPVSIPTVIGSTYRNLAANEGSVSGGPGSSAVGGWKNLSEAVYATNIRNTLTGAKRLDLPLVSQGAQPIDLIRRPLVNSNEDTANAVVFGQRYFAQASLRILLSDRASDLTDLPTVTAGTTSLSGNTAAGLTLASAIGPSSTTISGTASTYAAPYHQLNVAAVPSSMLLPNLTILGSTVTCTGKTANTFTGCGTVPAIPIGTTVTAALPAGGTATTTTVSLAVTAGTNKTITVTANGTIPFTHNFAWINDRTNNTPTPMTCEGYDLAPNPDQLKNCRIVGVTNAQTTNGRVVSTHSLSPAGTSQIGGFIKIERQNNAGVWSDVTAEILGLGFAGPNQEGAICIPAAGTVDRPNDPTPNAVIRIQRLRDNGGACTYANSTDYRDFWPNVLFDGREAWFRDVGSTTLTMPMGGVMNYVAIDIGNLKRWFAGTIGATGNQALNNNGYIVYFSDRRGNHEWGVNNHRETGEYGNEDSINPANAVLAANSILDAGEDRNENGTLGTATGLETYGARVTNDVPGVVPVGASAPFDTSATPLVSVTNGQARVNKQVLFRRALKLINGGINGGVNNLPDSGLTVATENGVYVQGNYNATSSNVEATPNRPASIIGDTITILSNSWSDVQSLNSPADNGGRPATTTGYRFAMVAGKSVAFPKPGWAGAGDFGTDGGVHNFMRMLEDWGGQTINYRGSMISLYTARQFTGIYRYHANTYNPGTRAFAFDTDFLDPFKLPPGTPMFRDVNTLRFRQILRPNQ